MPTSGSAFYEVPVTASKEDIWVEKIQERGTHHAHYNRRNSCIRSLNNHKICDYKTIGYML